jgi:hypothetical protein
MFALFRENFLPEGAGGGLLADAGGGTATPLAGEGGFVGAEGQVLVREAVGTLLVFSRTGGTKGSNRPVCSELAPMLLAPVSSNLVGEQESSSAR